MIEPVWLEEKLQKNAELRLENHRMRVFLQELTDPEGYGHAVTAEVRQLAKRILVGVEE